MAEKIDKGIHRAQTTINSLKEDIDVLKRSPGISDDTCRTRINESMKVIDKLRQDMQAYQTALNADPDDYSMGEDG